MKCKSIAVFLSVLLVALTSRIALANTVSCSNANPCTIYDNSQGSAFRGQNLNAGATGFANGIEGLSSIGNGIYGSSSFEDAVRGDGSGSGHSAVYGQINVPAATVSYGIAGRVVPYGASDAVYGDNVSSVGFSGDFTGRVRIGMGLIVAGSCIAGSCASDENLKKNISPLMNSIDVIAKLRPVSYEWKETNDRDHYAGVQVGFIAQDVEKVKPEWVSTNELGYKQINLNQLTPMMVDSVQYLKAKDEASQARIELLEHNCSLVLKFGIATMFACFISLLMVLRLTFFKSKV